tara:strand:+ start:635 stop:1285 length:651 start_codon:yes stop_codon:yes gene_type:complete
MSDIYIHHRIACHPLQWSATAEAIKNEASARIGDAGGALYGIWRSQIGLPRDTITVITVWSDTDSAIRMSDLLHDGMETVETVELDLMSPTLRPLLVEPPVRQGNFAFRWFEMQPNNFNEFLELCEAAWPEFENSYDSQIIGLWRVEGNDDGPIRTLLMTRRPNLAMWERSKIPDNEVEQAIRNKLNRRYDLCDWTNVYTTTLITAEDEQDETRWT